MILVWSGCAAPPDDPPAPWTPTPPASTSTEPYATDPLVSPSGWGTCADASAFVPFPSPEDGDLAAVAPTDGGERVLTGGGEGPLTLDAGGPAETTLAPVGDVVRFVASYGADGALAWVVPMQGTPQASVRGVASLADGGAAVVGAGDAVTTLGASGPIGGRGESDAFVAVLDPDGDLEWIRAFGSDDDDVATAVAVLPDSDLIVGATYRGLAVLGGGEPGEAAVGLVGEAVSGALVARFRGRDGGLVWARTFSGAASTELTDLAYVPGDGGIAILGSVVGPGATVFGAETDQPVQIAPLVADTWLARLDPDGGFVGVVSAGPVVFPGGLDVAADGGIVAGGWFADAAVFGRGEARESVIEAVGDQEPWVARFGADGALDWVTRGGVPPGETARGVDVASVGDEAVLVGTFDAAVSFGDAGSDHVRFVATEVESDGFVARFGPGGALRCALHLETEPGFLSGTWPVAVASRRDGGVDLIATLRGAGRLADATGEVVWTTVAPNGYLLALELR